MLLAGLQFNVSWFAQNKVCCQLCMDRVFPSWFGAGAVLEGEIGAESSLRRLGAALERICVYGFGKEKPTCALVPHGIGLQNFGACMGNIRVLPSSRVLLFQ